MAIEAGDERAFYDSHYSRFLEVPDEDARVDAAVMRATIENPALPQYERRRLYGAALDFIESLDLSGRKVLDYGCGIGEWGVLMATLGADVTLLDLSTVAVQVGIKRAVASGVKDRVRGVARDASDLSCFADAEFDIVFGCAALHHTLKYAGALEELGRVLKPGGMLILIETLGNNPLLNAARRLRARVEQEAEEQGEEIILSEREISLLRLRFRKVEVRPMNLLAMGKRLFRGRCHLRVVRAAVSALESADSVLLRVLPLGRYCGEALVIAEK